MEKLVKRMLVILLMFFQLLNFTGIVYAEADKLIIHSPTEQGYDDTPKYAETFTFTTLVKEGYEIIGGQGVHDSLVDGSYGLRETYDSTLPDVYCQRKSAKDFSVRYNWLHAAYFLTLTVNDRNSDLIKALGFSSGKLTYKDISKATTTAVLKDAAKYMREAFNELGTFTGTTAAQVDKYSERNKQGDGYVDIRAKGAIESITGMSPSDFSKEVVMTVKELNAAYDYNTGKSSCPSDNEVNINDSYEEKMDYSESQVKWYYAWYGKRYNLSGDQLKKLKEKWEKYNINEDEVTETIWDTIGTQEEEQNTSDNKRIEKEEKFDPDITTKFTYPDRTTDVASNDGQSSISDFVDDAESFISDTDSVSYLNADELQEFSNTMYSILLGIGIVIAVIIGLIIGIKLMFAPVGEKADAKKMLIPYAVGCVMIFGAFGIWKLVVTILGSM